MYEELQGFKAFLAESEQRPVSREAGVAELLRLSRGHYFFIRPVDHKLAEAFMNGHLLAPDFAKAAPAEVADIEKAIARLRAEQNSVVVVAVPKRWEKTLGRVNFHEAFAKMIGNSGASARYVWGAFSLYNPRLEENDGGHFYRNPQYHADDSLLNDWVKDHPQPVREKPAVPLDRQPRIFGHHLLDQGRHAFHGYNDPSPAV